MLGACAWCLPTQTGSGLGRTHKSFEELLISFVSIHKLKVALFCRGNNVIHYISLVRITSPNSQQFNMDCDDDGGCDNRYGADDDGDDEDDNGDGVLECDRGGQHDLAEQPFQGSAIYLFVGEGRHGDDIYIMMQFGLSVTKNHHFLLGVSCNHLKPP